jgi:hypothetical protein
MRNKSVWLTLLICVNLVLLTGIFIVGSPPRAAQAQATALSGNYVVVTGNIQSTLDAVYLLDLRERMLHAFFYEKGARRMQYAAPPRDLERDFRNNP